MEIKTPLSKIISTTKFHLERLGNLGVGTLGDFLTYFPRTYSDQSEFRKINEIRTDDINVVKGTLSQLVELKSKFGKKLLKAKFTDDTGSVDIIWFNQPYLKRVLYNGQQLILSGKAKFELGKITLLSPDHEVPKKNNLHVGRIIPIYHETEGLSSKWIREKIAPLLKSIKSLYPEYLPQNILTQHNFPPYFEAIQEIHFPSTPEKLKAAQDRLAFDELFLLQLKALQKKWHWQQVAQGEEISLPKHPAIGPFIASLPYELTEAQQKTLDEILTDQSHTFPMSRLLQGDVGSGKTVVSAIAIFNTILNGYQSALMAPTEILAEQHFRTINKLLENFQFPLVNGREIKVEYLTGSTKSALKTQVLNALANGQVDLVIGTHALIQEKVTFHKLGLAVIDEQHRFGVEQRSIIKSHGSPHLLSLSATPIPRTLAMTIYGDQDLSIIDQMPKGRLPIVTRIVPESKRLDSYRWIEDRVQTGRQAFVICPLIEDSDTLELKSVMAEYEHLQNEIFPTLKVGLLHGKMKAQEKDAIMQQFKENKINILVSTSVIEVGIDIPNATIMIIEGAERFGLSQLHQFRGRVGRGEHQSYCFLFMQNYSQTALQRLKAMVDHTSGFKLSEIDLELRGPGQIYGLRQSGIPDLKMASLSDSFTIAKARDAAEQIIQTDPLLQNHSLLAEKLNQLDNIYIKD
ncbi:MAG: ATP-dependent DNA helicase RecG [Candidatus Altimarinota bacterium]